MTAFGKRVAVLSLCAALLAGSGVLLTIYPAGGEVAQTPVGANRPALGADLAAASEGRLRVAFSEPGGFYSEDIALEITASASGASVYYTTDGSEPTSASDEYTEPIALRAFTALRVTVVKAIAVLGDVQTRAAVHTYFMGAGVDTRFDTLVFSLSTDSEHLYDYDTGILVEGRLRAEYRKANPNAIIQPPSPANYNIRGREGERPVYVEAYTPGGERVIAQAAGVRVMGGWSRSANQKSLRLIARNEYEPGFGKFHYDAFGDDYTSGGEALRKYDTLTLRNGGNDRDFAMLRSEVASELARSAEFREVTPSRAAAVFLNGAYYGFAWLITDINEQYLQDVYGARTSDFDIVGDGEQWYVSDNTKAVADLKAMYAYASKDLSDEKTFAEFASLVDVDNLLFYYAFNIYMGNGDWPGGNLKRWRYTGPRSEGDPPQLDGRWRYIIYDVDWTLGLYGENYRIPTFETVLGGSKNSRLLAAVLKNPGAAEKFITIMCDIASNVVTKDTVTELIRRLYGEAENEIGEAFAARRYSGWVSVNTVADNHRNMITFATRRGEYIFEALAKYFKLPSATVTLNVTGGRAVIGTQRGESATYFYGMDVPLAPALPEHYVFDYWKINGKTVYEPNTVIETGMYESEVKIELVSHYEPPALVIDGAYSSRERNGCVLRNTTGGLLITEGYYLSDNAANPFMWRLPDARIAAGGSLTLAGKGSADKNDLLKIQIGFPVRSGSVLILSDSEGNALDRVTVG